MNSPARRHLEDLLDREIEVARQLSLTLVAERAALTGSSPDTVRELAAEKTRLFVAIEQCETERRSLWESAATGDLGFGAAVAERWRSLLKLVAGCRTANEVNGHIIHIRQNQTRQLLDIVRGGAPLTYGPQGKTSAKVLRALARA